MSSQLNGTSAANKLLLKHREAHMSSSGECYDSIPKMDSSVVLHTPFRMGVLSNSYCAVHYTVHVCSVYISPFHGHRINFQKRKERLWWSTASILSAPKGIEFRIIQWHSYSTSLHILCMISLAFVRFQMVTLHLVVRRHVFRDKTETGRVSSSRIPQLTGALKNLLDKVQPNPQILGAS